MNRPSGSIADPDHLSIAESPEPERVRLPSFAGQQHANILRVLHQEILINIVDGRPVPNFLVYSRPWYRDSALMAMVLARTGNLGLIKDWILQLREPYDRNNAGEREADNPGEVLYLISLVSDRSHPLVPGSAPGTEETAKGRSHRGTQRLRDACRLPDTLGQSWSEIAGTARALHHSHHGRFVSSPLLVER